MDQDAGPFSLVAITPFCIKDHTPFSIYTLLCSNISWLFQLPPQACISAVGKRGKIQELDVFVPEFPHTCVLSHCPTLGYIAQLASKMLKMYILVQMACTKPAIFNWCAGSHWFAKRMFKIGNTDSVRATNLFLLDYQIKENGNSQHNNSHPV